MTRPAAPVLGSFAYWAKTDLAKCVRRANALGVDVDFMADSGAFSAYTTGKTITLKQYATWLRLYGPLINSAMTLDVIGDPAASARNTLALEDAVGGAVYVIPIFHVGSPWTELERWCSTHPYVALGGGVAVAQRERAFMQWLVRAHRVAAEHGAVLHGLGMTRPPYPDLLPFYSVDSSYWSGCVRTGTIGLFDPASGAFKRVRAGTQEVVTRRGAAGLVRSYGGNPDTFAEPGFARASMRGVETARAERDWMLDASVASWLRYTRHLATRHRPVPAPGPVRGDGPKIYLAASGEDDFDYIVCGVARLATERSPA